MLVKEIIFLQEITGYLNKVDGNPLSQIFGCRYIKHMTIIRQRISETICFQKGR